MREIRSRSAVFDKLRAVGMRPTRQRVALAELLFAGGNRHVTAEVLHKEAIGAQIPISLATIYNSLHKFTEAGILREVIVAGRSYFDTNIEHHHHFYFEDTGILEDVAAGDVMIANYPTPPDGREIGQVDVIIRIKG